MPSELSIPGNLKTILYSVLNCHSPTGSGAIISVNFRSILYTPFTSRDSVGESITSMSTPSCVVSYQSYP